MGLEACIYTPFKLCLWGILFSCACVHSSVCPSLFICIDIAFMCDLVLIFKVTELLNKSNLNQNDLLVCKINGLQHKKTCLRGFANNIGADQPALPGSLISAFVICFLESFICKLATGEVSIV